MANIIVATTYALSLWALLYCFLPWAGKLVSIYRLHDARDRIFSAARECTALSSTNMYLGAEYISTVSIYVVREGTYKESVAVASQMARHHDKVSDGSHCVEYDGEFDSLINEPNGIQAIQTLINSVRATELAISIRVITGNPANLAIGLIALIISALSGFVSMLCDAFVHGRKSMQRISVMPNTESICIPTVRPYADDEDSGPYSGIRTAFRIARAGTALVHAHNF